MTVSEISVPIELIEAGDIDAIRKLLPEKDLLGRWATSDKFGRVLVVESKADINQFIRVAVPASRGFATVDVGCLEFEPTELVTLEDLNNAPVGTVIANAKHENDVYLKVASRGWEHAGDLNRCGSVSLNINTTWTILRWGMGEK